MAAKKLVVYVPDELLDALNRFTATSPKSRSEILCDAITRYLTDQQAITAQEAEKAQEDRFFDRVAEMIQSGLLQPEDFSERPPDEDPGPKSKAWIN